MAKLQSKNKRITSRLIKLQNQGRKNQDISIQSVGNMIHQVKINKKSILFSKEHRKK